MTDDPYARLAAAAAAWEELGSRLSPQARDRLAEALSGLRPGGGASGAPRTADPEAAALTAARLLEAELPGEFPGESRFTAVRPAPADTVHLGFTATDLAVLVLDGHGMAGPVLGEVRDRLLAAPSLGDSEVLERGFDPYAPDLIRLRAVGGEVRLPTFQFAPGGAAAPVVRAVNALLGADSDPWGAADWWLSPNAWLDTVPARLIGTAEEHQLVQAARFLTEEE
ncbi:hypothetical protein [Streptomyces bambusae]|uniref:Uncharacterized protein n=1 Tax=Streptomyces bambusae TaxID=1550616 RepID=A0ABS6Z7D8_9ACTN|nr:hypothetical protein [Streptomyces bambusae]MBW5483324.1 hypothetical protein [Streptomyces bambusae]